MCFKPAFHRKRGLTEVRATKKVNVGWVKRTRRPNTKLQLFITRDCIAGVGMTTQRKTSRDAKNYSNVRSTAGEKTHVPPYKQPSTAVSRCRWNCIVNVKIEHAFRSTNPSAKPIPAVNRVAARLASRTQISASLFPIPYSLFPSRHRTTLSAFFAAAKPLILSSPFAPEKFAS